MAHFFNISNVVKVNIIEMDRMVRFTNSSNLVYVNSEPFYSNCFYSIEMTKSK